MEYRKLDSEIHANVVQLNKNHPIFIEQACSDKITVKQYEFLKQLLAKKLQPTVGQNNNKEQ